MFEIKEYVQPFLFEVFYEFICSIMLGAFINVMYREALYEILFPIIIIIPHVIAWRVSRAHLNPAISLAHLLRRDVKFNIIQFFAYVGALILGHWWESIFIITMDKYHINRSLFFYKLLPTKLLLLNSFCNFKIIIYIYNIVS